MPTNPLAGQTVTCTPRETADLLKHCITIGQPVFVAGDPGIGKSDVANQTARAIYGKPTDSLATGTMPYYRDVRAVLYDSVDVRGLPYIDTASNGHKITRWSLSSLWPNPPDDPTDGLILHDEINRAPASVQNALFQLVLDRALGDYRLPPGWQQIAAGNPSDVGVNKMSSALKSRFLRVNMVAHTPDWLAWATRQPGVNPAVIAYIKDHADQLHRYDPKADAFPSPRTWWFVARSIPTTPTLPAHIERALIAGSIGETYAQPFHAYLDLFRRLANRFDIDALLASPTSYQLPDSPSLAYAVANGLSLRITHTNIDAAFTYLGRLPSEYAIFAAKAALRRDPTLEHTRAYTVWYATHADAY